MQFVSMSISSFKIIDMKRKQWITACMLALILLSCNKTEKAGTVLNARTTDEELSSPDQKKEGGADRPPLAVSDSPASINLLSKALIPDWDKKIVKVATLRLEVKDMKSYDETVHNTIRQFGGYISSEEQNLLYDRTETVLSIKVPVDQFENMMNKLSGNSEKILERKINTEDVTGEYVDIRSRLEARKQIRLKYLEFLKQSKSMEEALQVQQEINAIQEEIEAAAGRVNYLSQQAAYSTIHLSYFQAVTGLNPNDHNPGFFTRVASSFRSGISWVEDIFVALISVWPVLLFLLMAWVTWKKMLPLRKPVRQNT